MSLSKTLYILLSTGTIKEDRIATQHDCKIVDWGVKHKHKQANKRSRLRP